MKNISRTLKRKDFHYLVHVLFLECQFLGFVVPKESIPLRAVPLISSDESWMLSSSLLGTPTRTATPPPALRQHHIVIGSNKYV